MTDFFASLFGSVFDLTLVSLQSVELQLHLPLRISGVGLVYT